MPTELVEGVHDITCRTEDSGKRYRVFLFTAETPTLFDTGLAETAESVFDGVEAVHVPGHEPDNHVLIDEQTGDAVMGDAVSGADQHGLPAGYFHLPPAAYSADLNEAERNLGRLLDYEFEVGLVFHGSSVTEDAREKLDRYVNFPGKP